MDELKPCPFCGGEAEFNEGAIYISKVVFVRCAKCKARTNFVFVNHPSISCKTGKLDESTRYTIEEATAKVIEAWNRRANND